MAGADLERGILKLHIMYILKDEKKRQDDIEVG
jgi:hypothetical protein